MGGGGEDRSRERLGFLSLTVFDPQWRAGMVRDERARSDVVPFAALLPPFRRNLLHRLYLLTDPDRRTGLAHLTPHVVVIIRI